MPLAAWSANAAEYHSANSLRLAGRAYVDSAHRAKLAITRVGSMACSRCRRTLTFITGRRNLQKSKLPDIEPHGLSATSRDLHISSCAIIAVGDEQVVRPRTKLVEAKAAAAVGHDIRARPQQGCHT
jgi:hypothetical protein